MKTLRGGLGSTRAAMDNARRDRDFTEEGLKPRHSSPSKPRSAGEEELALHLTAHGFKFVREFKFSSTRRWRADFCVLSRALGGAPLLVEVEGGTWNAGRHSRGSGMSSDMEKYNSATLLGFKLLRYTPDMVHKGIAINEILTLLGGNA